MCKTAPPRTPSFYQERLTSVNNTQYTRLGDQCRDSSAFSARLRYTFTSIISATRRINSITSGVPVHISAASSGRPDQAIRAVLPEPHSSSWARVRSAEECGGDDGGYRRELEKRRRIAGMAEKMPARALTRQWFISRSTTPTPKVQHMLYTWTPSRP